MQNRTNKRNVFKLSTIGINRCSDFGHYQYNSVSSILKKHYHKNILEICFCIKGQQFYKIEDNLYKLVGNDILIIPPNTNHSTGIYPEDIGELYWFQIYLDKQKGNLCSLPEEQTEALLEGLLEHKNKLFKGAFIMKNTLKEIEKHLVFENSILNQLKRDRLIIQLLVDTLTLAEKKQKKHLTTRIDLINDFISKNMNRIIFLDELASLVHLSTAYFKTWFKERIGIPPKTYINRIKIEQAKIDLQNASGITDVAFNLGFGSSQYFATVFKKHTGFSPTAYIQKSNKL